MTALVWPIFIVLAIVVAIVRPSVVRWWRRGCDACRLAGLNDDSRYFVSVAHTCWSWKSVYKDASGAVWEFGRKVRSRV